MNVKSEVTTTKLKSSSKTLQLSARFSRQIYLVWKKTALTVLLPRISSLTKSSKNTNAFRTWFHNARCSFWSQKKYKKVFCILGNERFGITFFLHRTSITCTLIFLLIFSQRPHNSRTRNHNLLFEKKKLKLLNITDNWHSYHCRVSVQQKVAKILSLTMIKIVFKYTSAGFLLDLSNLRSDFPNQ